MVITRLGQGVDRTGVLAPEALTRTLSTIADYAATCGELGVQKLRVTGTSAVRDAQNRDLFFDGVRKLTGSEPEMLSGEAEGAATFLGAVSDLDSSVPHLVVDIGGGSTELIYGIDAPLRSISLNIGCVRMFEKHLKTDPPGEDELHALRTEVTGELVRARDQLAVEPGFGLVGVAGTVTQLATMNAGALIYDPDITHHAVMSHGDVRMMARRLDSLTVDQRRRVTGMEAGRADVIVAGAEILLATMEVFDAAEVLTSEKDILDGLVLQLLSDD
ncbi:MAG: exopolyphosphatase / guanosine-5-triphosphate,3-diphosphate pyrophosphatase [Actinomycetota bacterium]|nr:exopolyphosphatase / guanosine-5-triphosphate,3-diphosphate pyrophosphatase [Actinomycetota bacterium]